jgi:preprotein translocase subunit SecG
MSFLIGLLTFILVLNCLLLILLVLIQLPKKEAGAGVAFGGAATDALFGAGTGNVLTKVTKYATITFFALAVIIGALQSSFYHRSGSEFERGVDAQAKGTPAATAGEAPEAAPVVLPPAAETPAPAKAATPLPPPPAAATNQ